VLWGDHMTINGIRESKWRLAVLMISTLVKAGKYSLFYAPIHEFELSRNTDTTERQLIFVKRKA
jgi:hypothetical protein